MAELNSWAVQAADGSGLIGTADARAAVGALTAPDGNVGARTGLRPGPGSPGLVSASAPTPDKNVHIEPFQLILQSSRGAEPYICTSDTQLDVDVLTGNPADASNPRNDLVVFQQSDVLYGDAASEFHVRHVVGTPSSTPTDPAVDGSPDYEIKARIEVPAGATEIAPGNVTNFDIGLTAALGGVIPVADGGARDNISQPYDGMTVWNRFASRLDVYTGGTRPWHPHSVPVVGSLAELGVADQYSGLVVLNLEDQQLYRFDAGTSTMVPTAGRHLIAEYTTAIGDSGVTFSGIPQQYRDLQIVIAGTKNTGTGIVNIRMQLNDDTGSARYVSILHRNYSDNTGGGIHYETVAMIVGEAGQVWRGTATIDIPGYSSAVTTHPAQGWGIAVNGTNSGGMEQFNAGGFWKASDPITKVYLYPGSASWDGNMTLHLYGIR